MISFKPRSFVQSSFDMRPDDHTCFFLFLFPFYLFGHIAFSEFFFCTISAFSLYGEYAVRSFLPDGVFSILWSRAGFLTSAYVVVVVVVFTLTDRASTIPSNILRGCQSGTWSQRGTKVNGSHHGDHPLLRPTGIQIATKSYATLQAMAPTNNKAVNQTSLLHIIESSLDRLGLFSPTHDQRSQQQIGQTRSNQF